VVPNQDGSSFWAKQNSHPASGQELFLTSPWVKMTDQLGAYPTLRYSRLVF
jgi:hypothetical protein